MPLASTKFGIPVIAFGAVIFAFSVWRHLGNPSSFEEALFLHRLSSSLSDGASILKLAELMPGDWELVCESHSYDGPLHLKRYNKTYPAAAPPQDGVWGFIFIAKDGSYRSAVGSCGSVGVHLNFDPRICIERQDAHLSLSPSRRESCATFSPKVVNPALHGDAPQPARPSP